MGNVCKRDTKAGDDFEKEEKKIEKEESKDLENDDDERNEIVVEKEKKVKKNDEIKEKKKVEDNDDDYDESLESNGEKEEPKEVAVEETVEEIAIKEITNRLKVGVKATYKGKWSMSNDIEEYGSEITFDLLFQGESIHEDIKVSGNGSEGSVEVKDFKVDGTLNGPVINVKVDFGKYSFNFEGNVTGNEVESEVPKFPFPGFQGTFSGKKMGIFYVMIT